MTQDPFGDIPLFRELQRLLSSSQGPLNTEIARQIAEAIAGQEPDQAVDADAPRVFDASVHDAETLLGGFTRLAADMPAVTRVITRRAWNAESANAWRWVLERTAQRFSQGLGGEANEPMAAVMGQIAPLLLGMQAGTLLGHLSLEVVARYDLPLPRDDDGALLFVHANVIKVADDYGFDRDAFRRWLALRETSRHLVFSAVPWASRYLRSLIVELIDAIEIDTSDLERKIAEMQSQGPEAFAEGLQPDAMIPIASTERHERARGRVRAFLAAFEGYANHASHAVGERLAAADARIEEGMRRHEASPSQGKTMLASFLGLERDRTLEQAGQTFCAAVTKLHGIEKLNQVWAAPDNLPTLAEIRDPFAWLERVED